MIFYGYCGSCLESRLILDDAQDALHFLFPKPNLKIKCENVSNLFCMLHHCNFDVTVWVNCRNVDFLFEFLPILLLWAYGDGSEWPGCFPPFFAGVLLWNLCLRPFIYSTWDLDSSQMRVRLHFPGFFGFVFSILIFFLSVQVFTRFSCCTMLIEWGWISFFFMSKIIRPTGKGLSIFLAVSIFF